MKIVKLSSGLGNQLFMYAFFMYIKEKYNDGVYFDDKYFKDKEGIARKSELSILYPDYPVYKFAFNPAGERHLKGKLYKLIRWIFPAFSIISEMDYDDSILYRGDVYFSGFWQTDKYVNQLDKNLFDPQEPIPDMIKKNLSMIEGCDIPVSIHFRRGDYFSPKYINRYGVCTVNYYQRAMQFIEKTQNGRITYFVFSDDLEWVNDNIQFNQDHVFVPNDNVNSYWYIYLMSKCEHNIISNSTFSWWGAYLNKNNNKIVLGPNKWMLDSNFDLMCPNWIKIEI